MGVGDGGSINGTKRGDPHIRRCHIRAGEFEVEGLVKVLL